MRSIRSSPRLHRRAEKVMATQKRTAPNGNGPKTGNGHAAAAKPPRKPVNISAQTIGRVADEVWQGAEAQTRSLDQALHVMQGMSASLRETAAQSEDVSTAAEEILSGMNEMSASIEEVASNTTKLASFIAQNAASARETSASIESVTNTTTTMATAAEEVTTSVNEMAASIKGVTRD